MSCPAQSPARPRAPHPLIIESCEYDRPEADRLTQALHAEQHALYGFADDPSDISPEEFSPPRGLFVIGREYPHGIPIACGGWHVMDTHLGAAEIKRMFVHRDARSRGYGRAILHHLERTATEAGARRMLLETGRDNTRALVLYTSCGYRPMPPYAPGRDPAINRALTKILA